MFIARRFTTPGNPYPGVTFVSREVVRRTPAGPVQVTVTVPQDWDQTAVDVLATKYMRRAGVPAATERVVEDAAMPEWMHRSQAPDLSVPDEMDPPGGEHDARSVFHRLAGCWAYWGWKQGHFSGDGPLTAADSALAFYEEMLYLLATRRFSPNSPQWFNTGLNWAYGIEAPDSGQWAIDHGRDINTRKTVGFKVSRAGPGYVRPAANACFILGLRDSLLDKGGIYDLLEREARIFKYGGGAGANYSTLRGEGEPLAGGGFSSGMMSFLGTFDAGAGSIKSGGVTRRAAKMVCVDADHPDIEKFIDWKGKEEYRAACVVTGDGASRAAGSGVMGSSLAVDIVHPWVIRRRAEAAKMGFDPFPAEAFTDHFEGEWSAYQGVGGQNANNSVRLTNEFMTAVEQGGRWHLTRRTDGTVCKTLDARDLWQRICRAAWLCADPGVQFDTTWNDWNLCPEDGRIRATNPCSEYGWLDDTACNLGSVRLTKFATRGQRGEITGLAVADMEHACRLGTVALDITVGMAGYPSEAVAEGSRKYRTIGLGYCDLGAFLMQAGHAYDSPGGRAWAAALTSLMHSAATSTSAILAHDLGAFPQYAANKEHALRVVGNHARWSLRVGGYPAKPYAGLGVEPPDVYAEGVVPRGVLDDVSRAGTTAAAQVQSYGLRNAQLTLIAPTGTIGLQLGCDTTGIEPDFALVKDKKLVGGGYFKIVNQGVPAALAALGYPEDQADQIVDYVFGTRAIGGKLLDLLAGLGLNEHEVDRLRTSVKAANTLNDALKRAVPPGRWAHLIGCGEEFAASQAFRPLHSLLWKLNPVWDYTTLLREAAEWEDEVMGTGTVEEAPHLQVADYAVFDCATPSGQGSRCIRPMGHVLMMAAAQPALSGGISKTINMPADATPDDVSEVYTAAHRQMVKCAALYLDGSKLSQPLNAVRGAGADEDDGTGIYPQTGVLAARVLLGGLKLPRPQPATPVHPQGATAFPDPAGDTFTEFGPEPDPAGDEVHTDAPDDTTYHDEPASPTRGREKLPSRRAGYTQKMRVGRQKVFVRTGEYPDGRLGEIFLDVAEQGSAFRAMSNALAQAVSLGLQYGVPLEEYVDAFVGSQFEPAGVVTDHARIKMGSSILDAIFKDLAITYLSRDDLAHVQPDTTPPPQDAPRFPPPAGDPAWVHGLKLKADAPAPKDTGSLCPECGNFSLRQTGTCKSCTRCFWHSGCG